MAVGIKDRTRAAPQWKRRPSNRQAMVVRDGPFAVNPDPFEMGPVGATHRTADTCDFGRIVGEAVVTMESGAAPKLIGIVQQLTNRDKAELQFRCDGVQIGSASCLVEENPVHPPGPDRDRFNELEAIPVRERTAEEKLEFDALLDCVGYGPVRLNLVAWDGPDALESLIFDTIIQLSDQMGCEGRVRVGTDELPDSKLVALGHRVFVAGGNEGHDNLNPLSLVDGVTSMGATTVNQTLATYSSSYVDIWGQRSRSIGPAPGGWSLWRDGIADIAAGPETRVTQPPTPWWEAHNQLRRPALSGTSFSSGPVVGGFLYSLAA